MLASSILNSEIPLYCSLADAHYELKDTAEPSRLKKRRTRWTKQPSTIHNPPLAGAKSLPQSSVSSTWSVSPESSFIEERELLLRTYSFLLREY